MASLNDTVFGILKADTRVNPDALERLVDLASRDPVLNAYLAQAQANGGVKFRLDVGAELADAGAAALFDPDTTGRDNDNSMVIVLNPAWLVGENAGFATLSKSLLKTGNVSDPFDPPPLILQGGKFRGKTSRPQEIVEIGGWLNG